MTPGYEQQYLKHGQCTRQQIKTILRIRLHMISTKKNHKRDEEDTKCRKCVENEETTEHVLDCYTNTKFDIQKIEDTNWLKEIAPLYEEIHELHQDTEKKKNEENEEEKEEE